MELRILNVMAGAWLVVSAFVWQRATAQRVNTWVVGALVTVLALVSLRLPAARWANVLLAAWLFASAIILPREGSFGLWNNLLASFAILFVAAVPSYDDSVRAGRAPA